MAERLYEKYKAEIMPAMKKELKLTNSLQVPKVVKITLNSGVGAIRDNKELLESFMQELADIAGQKPKVTKARLSESGFKIKQGDVVGVVVTLRHGRMWAFLDKFINIVLPRMRDFRGLDLNAFDKKGNYTIGVREHTIFPEVNPNKTKGIRSLQVTIVTNAGGVEDSRLLLKYLGMPFRSR